MRHVLMFSGGLGSWAAGKRVLLAGGPLTDLLFTDTLIEDDDLYRFLIEGAANLLACPAPQWEHLLPLCQSIPPLERMAERKAHLLMLRRAARASIPGLHWHADGRTPWDVFRDTRFLGNTRVAKCSLQLKQDVARAWLESNCTPAETVIYLGLDWSESHRFEGRGGKHGARQLWLPWHAEAPLCGEPRVSKHEIANWLEREGIDPPRLYDLGFNHNNCGAFCIKAGQAHFRQLLKTMPERYAYHEKQEQELREHLGKDVSILRDRRGGPVTPLPMADFRERLQTGTQCDLFDWGGCGCFSDPSEAEGKDQE